MECAAPVQIDTVVFLADHFVHPPVEKSALASWS